MTLRAVKSFGPPLQILGLSEDLFIAAQAILTEAARDSHYTLGPYNSDQAKLRTIHSAIDVFAALASTEPLVNLEDLARAAKSLRRLAEKAKRMNGIGDKAQNGLHDFAASLSDLVFDLDAALD